METVEGPDGRRYIRLKRSSQASLVHDPVADETTYLPNTDLEPIRDESPLSLAAAVVHPDVRRLCGAVPSERALGLLVTLDTEPLPVRRLLEETTYCESDLFGVLRSLTVAGLLERDPDATEDTYRTTETASRALERLRQS